MAHNTQESLDMTEKVYRVPIADVTAVRVVCGRCGDVIETSPARVGRATTDKNCRSCGEEIESESPRGRPLSLLATALRELQESENLRVELVVKPPNF